MLDQNSIRLIIVKNQLAGIKQILDTKDRKSMINDQTPRIRPSHPQETFGLVGTARSDLLLFVPALCPPPSPLSSEWRPRSSSPWKIIFWINFRKLFIAKLKKSRCLQGDTFFWVFCGFIYIVFVPKTSVFYTRFTILTTLPNFV